MNDDAIHIADLHYLKPYCKQAEQLEAEYLQNILLRFNIRYLAIFEIIHKNVFKQQKSGSLLDTKTSIIDPSLYSMGVQCCPHPQVCQLQRRTNNLGFRCVKLSHHPRGQTTSNNNILLHTWHGCFHLLVMRIAAAQSLKGVLLGLWQYHQSNQQQCRKLVDSAWNGRETKSGEFAGNVVDYSMSLDMMYRSGILN